MLNKHPRTQIFCLEVLEYLTCVSTLTFHNEIHTKDFLQIINNYLNNATTDEVIFLNEKIFRCVTRS